MIPGKKRKDLKPLGTLRERAERMVRTTPGEITKMSAREVQRMVSELQVHQIELELQNQELRETQIALFESRDRYSDLYEFAPVGYVTLDKTGKILESNLAAATMLGVNRRAMMQTSITKFIKRESQDEWYKCRNAIFSGDTKEMCEVEMNNSLWLRMESIAFGSEGDRQCRTVLIDITGRKTAEEALRTLSRTLDTRVQQQTAQIAVQAKAIANLGEGVLITEGSSWPDARIVFVNEAFCHITGNTAEELIGQARRILRGRWIDRETLDRIHGELSAGRAYRAEWVNFRKDGTPYDAEVTITPLFDTAGRCTNFVSIHRDVTERKKAEQGVREREARLQALLNATPSSVVTINRSGIIIDANRATERMFGYTLNELVGQNFNILMPSPDREEHDAYIARYLDTGKNIMGTTLETVGLRKDGSTFPAELAVVEMADLVLFIGILRDITARKEAQGRLDQYRRDLQIMASELMLAEERQRQKLAEDLHDSIGQALFRLQTKIGQASIAQPAAKAIGAIIDQIGKVVNTLTFELSPPILHQLGLRSAIKWLVSDMRQRYDLSIQIDDDGQDAPIDERVRTVLFRCVREILVNVVKHSHTQLARISIRRSDPYLKVKIQDRGKGFDPAIQSHSIEGGHFGLFSIRERLEYLGGTLQIQSQPGRGTTVTLTVPLQQSPEQKS